MAAHSLCRECGGTGWILYRSETVDGELEEAYRLCPNYCTPRRCMGSKTGHLRPHPGTVLYALGYYCEEHIEGIRADDEVNHAHEPIYYLRGWLRIARGKANEFLEMQLQLSETLSQAETQLQRAEQEPGQAWKDADHPI